MLTRVCVVVCRDRSDSNGIVIVVDVLRQRARRCIINENPSTRKISGRDRGVLCVADIR